MNEPPKKTSDADDSKGRSRARGGFIGGLRLVEKRAWIVVQIVASIMTAVVVLVWILKEGVGSALHILLQAVLWVIVGIGALIVVRLVHPKH